MLAPCMPAIFLLSLLAAQSPAEAAKKLRVPLGLDAYMPIPEDNLLTPEKVSLGQRLFLDKRLSRDQSISCATCHEPDRAFTDAKAVAVGVFDRKGPRGTPTIVNRAYGKAFFWDGRIRTLEEQVLQPILAEKEMDITVEEVVARLKESDRDRREFQDVFGREINPVDLARALASYVRTILSGDSPYDRYINGDRNALSEQARRGLRIFRGKGNCTDCHLGPNLTDERFHNTGVAWRDGRFVDPGRYAVTQNERDRGKFKTPTLREIARTAPYMHDGSLARLEDVVKYYDRGGNRAPNLDSDLHPLNLKRDEKRALVVFLEALSGTIREGL
ncbi:cytochrome-c peroxidase [Acidobacteria bacterium AH-259-O06]|nr:cytochrome-c peroxidase [Acidobacteria bacterium AH-259-O06]